MNSITVVIVTYNRPDLMRELLARLAGQASLPEIIICDDGSIHANMPPGFGPQVSKYTWTRDDGYHRVARFNEGMGHVVTPYAILLDDDQIPVDDQFTQAYFDQLHIAPVVRGLGIDNETNKSVEVPWWSTANMGIELEAWRHLGGLDPAYDGNYAYEDLDFGRKVLAHKVDWIWGNEHTATLHKGEPYSGNRDSQEINQRYFYQKWGRE